MYLMINNSHGFIELACLMTISLLELVEQAGANVNIQGNFGDTPQGNFTL